MQFRVEILETAQMESMEMGERLKDGVKIGFKEVGDVWFAVVSVESGFSGLLVFSLLFSLSRGFLVFGGKVCSNFETFFSRALILFFRDLFSCLVFPKFSIRFSHLTFILFSCFSEIFNSFSKVF